MIWKVRTENLIRFGQDGFRLYVARSDFQGRIAVIQPPLIMKDQDEGSFVVPDDALLDDAKMAGNYHDVRGFLQAMSDAAWEIGIKPKQLESHASELTAVRYHLEDMRQIAGVKQIIGTKS